MSLLRKKKFRAIVFLASGSLILYNVYFFTIGKKKPPAPPANPKKKSAPAGDEKAAGSAAPGAWGEAKSGLPGGKPSGAASAAKDSGTGFGRDPFVLPDEEAEGKTFETVFRERLERSRAAENTPLHEILTQLGVLKLTGILHDEKRPVAVINHRIVRAGDSLLNGFFDVIGIEPEIVRVRHGGREYDLRLPAKKTIEPAPEIPAAAPAEKE